LIRHHAVTLDTTRRRESFESPHGSAVGLTLARGPPNGFLEVRPGGKFAMVKLKSTFLALIGMVLASCAAPKTAVVEQAPAPKNDKAAPEPVAPEPELAAFPDEGLRLPEMLDLPTDGEFRATNPPVSRTGSEAGAVISRPPTDPPSRVKPPAPAPE
jgi:hypothetical protein